MESRSPRMSNRYERGATLAELLYVMPLFFALLFGIFELAYAYRTRATLNTATFQAARAGATAHALLTPMRDRLARSMIPLYMRGESNAADYVGAYAATRTLVASLQRLPWAPEPVRVISPNREVFDAFKEPRVLRLPGERRAKTRMVIPNDNLKWRSPALENVRINGSDQQVNIQDANLLKITTYWCHPLRTPLLDRLINEAVSGLLGLLRATPEQRACNAVGLISGTYYLAITSQAVVRMQSDVVREGNNLN